nr:hypothetical protein [Nocardioides anomalus]
MGVTKVVKPLVTQSGVADHLCEALGDPLWVDRGSVVAGEDEVVIGVRRSPRGDVRRLQESLSFQEI